MNSWDAPPLWMVFEQAGVDPQALAAKPLQGPKPLTDKQIAWQVEKARNKLQREVEKFETGRAQPRWGREQQVWRAVARAKQLVRYRG